VDFGLGIGYSTEPNNPSSNTVPTRSAAVNSLRTGMMSQFRSSFVAASSTSQNEGFSNTTSVAVNKRPTLAGFVSGGSIGGDINIHQQIASYNNPATSAANSTSQSSGVNPGQNSTNRLIF
jgi:ATP-dependent RNA helicase DDX42